MKNFVTINKLVIDFSLITKHGVRLEMVLDAARESAGVDLYEELMKYVVDALQGMDAKVLGHGAYGYVWVTVQINCDICNIPTIRKIVNIAVLKWIKDFEVNRL